MDIQSILTLLTLISVPIGVLYHIMTLNNQTKSQKHVQETRQAQLYTQLYSFYDNKEFLKDYGNITTNMPFKDAEDWWNKYSPEHDIEAYAAWLRVGRFFDGVVSARIHSIDWYLDKTPQTRDTITRIHAPYSSWGMMYGSFNRFRETLLTNSGAFL